VASYRISAVAALVGVSDDTVRRWAESGRLPTVRDEAGRLAVDGAALAAFMTGLAESAEPPDPGLGPMVAESARNRFAGIVTAVERDGVVAKVELRSGPHRIVSLMTREAADELELAPGVLAVASVKSTNVTVEVPQRTGTGR